MTTPKRKLSRAAEAILSDRFHFGWCNACERYACGQSADTIRATPTIDSTAVTEREAHAVTAGVHAALAIITDGTYGARASAKKTARVFGVRGSKLADLVAIALDA